MTTDDLQGLPPERRPAEHQARAELALERALRLLMGLRDTLASAPAPDADITAAVAQGIDAAISEVESGLEHDRQSFFALLHVLKDLQLRENFIRHLFEVDHKGGNP
jgi:hypothetical protein